MRCSASAASCKRPTTRGWPSIARAARPSAPRERRAMPREPSAAGVARLAALERLMQAMVAIEGAPEAIARAQHEKFAGFGLDPRDAEALAAAPVRQINV